MNPPMPMKATDLERVELPDGKMATVLRVVEVQPNAVSPRHMHPGIEVGYVLEGAIHFTFDGQAPKVFIRERAFRSRCACPTWPQPEPRASSF